VIRFVGAGLLVAALSLTLAAQGPDKDVRKSAVKKGEEQLKAMPEKGAPGKAGPANAEPGNPAPADAEPGKGEPGKEGPPAPPAEDPKVIIDRLKKNFNSTEERLDGKDPGTDTERRQ
jgi:hypothetical protein